MINNEKTLVKTQRQYKLLNSNNILAENQLKHNYYNILKGFNCIKQDKIFILYDRFKRPISPITGKLIGINNKKHFVDLKTALNALNKYKNVLGVGVVLGNTAKDNICAIDIDCCIDNKGNYSDDVQNILTLFEGSYIEKSKSGCGLHIIFLGKKHDGWLCKTNRHKFCKSLECYDRNRYIALTGDVLYKNGSLINHQAELQTFYKKYFTKPTTMFSYSKPVRLNKLKDGLKRDNKFAQLWQGVRFFTDESRNDQALMAKIMYWCGYDVNFAIETFKSSPYALQKDNAHQAKLSRADYLFRTAKKCLQGVVYGKL